MGQINKIKILGKTIQSQKPTFSISSQMKSSELFSLFQKDINGNLIESTDINISLKSLKSYNESVPICDEISIDLVAQKTYHIRRIGKCVLQSLTGGYKANGELFTGYTIPKDSESNLSFEPNSYVYSYCDKMCTQEKEIESFNANREFCGNLNGDISDKWYFKIKASTVGKNTNQSFLEWSQNTPITIYAKLQEPIITEIEHITINPLATNFELEVYNQNTDVKPDLFIEYEKDYKIAIKEVEVEIDNVENEITELQNSKFNKPSLTTIIVDTPIWTNQPTISGSLDSAFKIWSDDYYFATLKNTDGTPLPFGQFKLTTIKDGYATAINQIFNLANLNTGNSGTISENTTVDFKEINNNWKLRNAGIISFTTQINSNNTIKYIINTKLIAQNVGSYLSAYLPVGYTSYCWSAKYSSSMLISNAFTTAKYQNYTIEYEVKPNNISNQIYVYCMVSGATANSSDFSSGYSFQSKTNQPVTTAIYSSQLPTSFYVGLNCNNSNEKSFFGNGTIINYEIY